MKEIWKLHILKKYQEHISWSFPHKVVCTDDKFSKPFLLFEKKKNQSINLLKSFLKEMNIAKIHFNKNLVTSAEHERSFKLSNKCWISDKLFVAADNKVRDQDHVTGKYRGSAHWICNLKLTKKVSVIFHNLKGYDSHLIMD